MHRLRQIEEVCEIYEEHNMQYIVTGDLNSVAYAQDGQEFTHQHGPLDAIITNIDSRYRCNLSSSDHQSMLVELGRIHQRLAKERPTREAMLKN